jgi:hypothetical protein
MRAHLSKGYQLMGPTEVDSVTPQREHETGRGYKVPNGAIYTTVGDLAHFASFLLGQGPGERVGRPQVSRFQMQSPVPAERSENYVAFGHGGAVAGYTAELLMNRKAGVGLIVLSNGAANPTSIAGRGFDILSKQSTRASRHFSRSRCTGCLLVASYVIKDYRPILKARLERCINNPADRDAVYPRGLAHPVPRGCPDPLGCRRVIHAG